MRGGRVNHRRQRAEIGNDAHARRRYALRHQIRLLRGGRGDEMVNVAVVFELDQVMGFHRQRDREILAYLAADVRAAGQVCLHQLG